MTCRSLPSFAGRPLTIGAALLAFFATSLLTVDAATLLIDALHWSDYGTCMKLISLYVPIYFLMFGTASYLATRYGFFSRSDNYLQRTNEQRIKRIYGKYSPSVAILVPSYKEEEEIIRQTLLSAALAEYPDRQVVLLLDDPPYSRDPEDQRRSNAARKLVEELGTLFRSAADKLKSEQALYREREREGQLEPAFEVVHLSHLYAEVASWIERQADNFLRGRSRQSLDRTDIFFLDNILTAPARAHRQHSQWIIELPIDRVDAGIEYRRLASLFDVDFSIFERKKYANLSHAPNKAMNLNSYIGLIGKRFVERLHEDGLWLVRTDCDDANLAVPAADYILNLDADTLLLSDYALRLVDIMEEPGNEKLAVAQTPYSAYPGAPSVLEHVAGATTDVQYLTHQGMSFFDATAWVGANALIRRKALEEIAVYVEERGHRVPVYIQDKTLIEDTAASIDLINKKWRLYNHCARLAYSATPPDFGSLLIQRRRWANGGILIFPNLVQYVFQHPLSLNRLMEGFVRSNYLLSPAFSSIGMIILLLSSFDDYLFSIWVPLAAIPYQIVYGFDLELAGYRWRDLPRVYALNMMLIPVYMGGTLQSIRQAFTGVKAPFGRTPKVAGRTSTQLLYLGSLYGMLFWCVFVLFEDAAAGRTYHMIFASINSAAYLYGVTRFIGLRASWEDLIAHARGRGQRGGGDEIQIGDAEIGNDRPWRLPAEGKVGSAVSSQNVADRAVPTVIG
jgi:cellulose synthase (UDP-forming)